MIKEHWKAVVGYEGLYEVSNLGRVRSLNYNRTGNIKILSQHLNNKGYCLVTLSKNSISQTLSVHRLVAIAFIPNPDNLPQVNHKNFIRTDNRVENLEWISNRNNVVYSFNRQCAMLDDEGNIVLTADCARQMSQKTGFPETGIRYCLQHKRKKTHGKKFILLKEYYS